MQMHSLMGFTWQLLSTMSQQPTRNLHFSPSTLPPHKARREKNGIQNQRKKKIKDKWDQSKRKLTIKPI